jgi:uncharacterized protein YaiI (UPF0178 family)
VRIHVDADGCPVKQEVYRVAKRYGLRVFVVANGGVDAPADANVELVRVPAGPDAADDWIVEHLEARDIVVTADIPLAARCIAMNASAIHPAGKPFSENDIGSALAMRDLLKSLRDAGERTRGPAPFTERDRSSFLQALDVAIQRGRRVR